MTPAPIWRLAPGQRLLYRCWDGECVLYNDLSGDIHLLDECALALLEQVQRAPQAAAQLAAAFGLAPDSDLAAGTDAPHADAAVLHDMLADLAALHLVEAIPC
jgi:PqqD family protein of HPr-rel-A system